MLASYGRPARRLFTLGIKLAAPVMGPDSTRSWVQIARTGEFKGHQSGPFELTKKELSEMVRNFDRDGEPVPIVLGHPDTETPAYGWIHDLELRGDELWALAEWHEDIVPLIRDGRFRGCSMVFSTESVDRESGEGIGAELFELGITNRPFLNGMAPLTASRRLLGFQRKDLRLMNIDRKKIMEALDELPKDASVEQFHMALEAALLAQAAQEKSEAEPEAPAEQLGEPPMPVPEYPLSDASVVKAAETESTAAPDDAGAAAKDQIVGALEKALGTDMAGVLAFVQDNADKLASLAKEEPKSGTPADDQAQKAASHDIEAVKLSALHARLEIAERNVSEYQARLAAFEAKEKELADGELVGLVDHAVEKGHILPAHRETFIKLGRLDRQALDSELEKFKAAPAVITRKLVNARAVETTEFEAQDDAERDIMRLLAHSTPALRKLAIEKYRAKKQNGLNGRA
jgi:phage I-like protein